MSALTDLIYAGSNAVAGLTEGAVNDAIAKHGADTPVAFPDTAYFFPTIYARHRREGEDPGGPARLCGRPQEPDHQPGRHRPGPQRGPCHRRGG